MLPDITVIVPSYNPDEKLVAVVTGLVEAGFEDILVVNDGSKEDKLEPFNEVAKFAQCKVIVHEVNKGKGRAMKTAFEYVLNRGKKNLGVITVDGDNQHTVKDIIACSEKLKENPDKVIIGCRDFSLPDVPPRSRFGNNLTKAVFRLACGIKISDTQTGLRTIPYDALLDFIAMEGERYEYETNMLLEMKRLKYEFIEVPIETVYIEDNESSHFNPIKDSIKIYKVIFKYIYKFILSSVASTIVDLTMFNVVLFFAKKVLNKSKSLFVATATARVISSLFNYTMNKKAVFASDASVKSSMAKYYTLALGQIILSWGLVNGITHLLNVKGQGLTTVIKMIVDTSLFFGSYKIQKKWVFKK